MMILMRVGKKISMTKMNRISNSSIVHKFAPIFRVVANPSEVFGLVEICDISS